MSPSGPMVSFIDFTENFSMIFLSISGCASRIFASTVHDIFLPNRANQLLLQQILEHQFRRPSRALPIVPTLSYFLDQHASSWVIQYTKRPTSLRMHPIQLLRSDRTETSLNWILYWCQQCVALPFSQSTLDQVPIQVENNIGWRYWNSKALWRSSECLTASKRLINPFQQFSSGFTSLIRSCTSYNFVQFPGRRMLEVTMQLENFRPGKYNWFRVYMR